MIGHERGAEIPGGGLSVMNNMVGPEGGQVLVDSTAEAIRELWK